MDIHSRELTVDDLVGYGITVTESDGNVVIMRTTKKGTYPLPRRVNNWGGEVVQFRVGSQVKSMTVARIVYVWAHGRIGAGEQIIFRNGNNRDYSDNNMRAVSTREANLWRFIKSSI